MPRRRLRAAWERNAADWIRWTRDPAELDGHYVRYHRDLFLELLPAPPAERLTSVVAVDTSPTMVAAAHEAARVLVPGGHVCLAIVDPVSSAGGFATREAGARFVIDGSYLDESYFVDGIERDGRRLRLAKPYSPRWRRIPSSRTCAP